MKHLEPQVAKFQYGRPSAEGKIYNSGNVSRTNSSAWGSTAKACPAPLRDHLLEFGSAALGICVFCR
jgi:hypothetical protein